jgi:hypothetical protein
MPRIIVEASTSRDGAALLTLGERVVSENLDDPHYAAQLIARIRWATGDAEALEADVPDEAQALDGGAHARHVAVLVPRATA